MKKIYFLISCLFIFSNCFESNNIKNHKGEPINISENRAYQKNKIRNEPAANAVDGRIEKYRISSEALDYDLQYWVQTPKGYDENKSYPTLYVTDGHGYKNDGKMPEIVDRLIANGKIQPIIIIFVDPRDPDNLQKNRRNYEFLCNPKYVEFYKQELIPTIDQKFSTDASQKTRGVLGLSFGGLNSLYFGAFAHDVFGKIGVFSPAPHPCPEIYDEYQFRFTMPVDIFLSTGTKKDKEAATRKFREILKGRGYEFKYVEVPEGHNWRNWGPLIDDVLVYFYGK